MRATQTVISVASAALWACSEEPAPTPEFEAPDPFRLTSYGDFAVKYDGKGHPTLIEARNATFGVTWTAGHIQEMTCTSGSTVIATPTYDGDRIVALDCVDGWCGTAGSAQARHDVLTYDEAGSLATWETTGSFAQKLQFTYDREGRLIRIQEGSSLRIIHYGAGDCPEFTAIDPSWVEAFEYSDGRLAAAHGFAVQYNADGWIERFDGTGPAFAPLRYEPGELKGLDVWPGAFHDDFFYGFPADGELFHLDGRCDPTLPNDKIATMILASLSWGSSSPEF